MSEYACDAEGNYNACTRAYKDDPSIELYLKLRRENPDNEIEISFLGGMEQPQMPYTERGYSEATAREIDSAVKSIVEAAFRRTVNLLRAQREVLERGARLLLQKETLDEADLLALRQPEPVGAAE